MLGGKKATEKLSDESFYTLRLNEWSARIPVTKLSSDWERNMLALVPSEVQRRHPRRVESTLEEIRCMYENDMRNCAVASIMNNYSTADGDAAIDEEETAFRAKNVPRTAFRAKTVPRQRATLSSKYFLSHSVVQHIVATANSVLPRVIVDLDEYRKTDFFEVRELEDAVARSVERCAATIENDYYGETVRVFEVFERNIDRRRLERLVNCATNVFAQQIVKLMMRTVDETIEKLGDYGRQRCPRVLLKLAWINNCLSIEPAISKVHSVWHCLIDSVESVASRLPRFQDAKASTEDANKNFIKIGLPDWYAKASHDRVERIMSEIFEPLRRDFSSMAREFGAVACIEMRDNGISCNSVLRGGSSEVYRSYVEKLKKHYARANEMVDRVEYDVGVLGQTEAKSGLKERIAEMMSAIVGKLSTRHIRYNEKICRDFQELEDRMLDIPKDAAALFRLSESISHASTVLMEELESRVRKSIDMLCSLIVITSEMSQRHIDLNATTINWLARIAPVFNRSNTLCEAMKSELEDELQRKISKLKIDIESIVPQLEILNDMDDAGRVEEYESHLAALVDRLDELDRQIDRINFEERLLKFPETSFTSVTEIRNIVIPVEALNSLSCQWRRDNSVWLDGPFEYIDPDHVTTKTTRYHDEFGKLNANLKTKIKAEMQSSTAGKRLFNFGGIVDDPDPMQQPAPLKLCWQVLREVAQFKEYLELIACMCNPALCDRHWKEISLIYYGEGVDETNGDSIAPNAGTTLRKFIALDLNRDIEKYKVVSVGANKELALRRQLDSMIAQWDDVEFTVVLDKSQHENSNESRKRRYKPSIIANLDDIRNLMEQHFALIREIKVSYFVKPIGSALEEFKSSLLRVSGLIDKWLDVQNQWFDIESIFRSPAVETSQQLSHAAELFYQSYEPVDAVERYIGDKRKFRSIVEESLRFFVLLDETAQHLEIVRETVKSHIDRVRDIYPRLNFISDRSVTRILFETRTNRRIELMLKHCFNGIRRIRVDERDEETTSPRCVIIVDENDDELPLPSITAVDLIYDANLSSFAAIEGSITSAVRQQIFRSFREDSYKATRDQCRSSIGELCGMGLYWTCRVEEALASADPAAELASWHREERSYLRSIAEQLIGGKLSRKYRNKLVSMIIILRHQQDITKLLIINGKKRSLSRRDFDWKAQTRYYWQDDDLKVEILDTRVAYGYEYRSSEKPMVSTPATDRCYRTIIEAHRNRLNGALIGPAASSKSQCIEGLARTLGVPLRLFDCHENFLNYSCIGNLFEGLVGCSPCWLSFDNVNCLTVEMQSVLAQRVSALSRIVSNYETRCCLVTVTSIFPYSNFECTPRRRLIDSLKILFRPVAMTVPDTRRIVEIQLFAEGFAHAEILSNKNYLLERYASDLTTRATSSDISMRTAMRVVETACALKNRYPDEAEERLFLRALLDVHLPKLERTDVVVFKNIIDDLFPGLKLPPPNYDKLLSAVEELIGRENSSATDYLAYTLKIIQLLETILVRHAIIVVGPTLAGKTSLIHNLSASLSLLDDDTNRIVVETARINHVSLSFEQLLGRYEPNNFGKLQWKDGLLTRNIRCSADRVERKKRGNDQHSNWQWIILDGPIDHFFLDHFHSLLGDDKTLSLTSGERIKITDGMSVIVETTSIDKSSPSAISRCGIIYVDEGTISLDVHIDRWIAQHRDVFSCQTKDMEFFDSLLKWSLNASLSFVNETSMKRSSLSVMTNNCHMMISALGLLEMYLREANGGSAPQTATNHNREGVLSDRARCSQSFVWFQAALVMAIVWGIGGPLDRRSRTALDEFCTSLWRGDSSSEHSPPPLQRELMKRYELTLPSEGRVQDNTYTFVGTGSWRHWSDLLKRTDSQQCTDYVPTVESVGYISLFETHVKYRKPFVITGETATGKTLYMRHLLKTRISENRIVWNFMSLGVGRRTFISDLTKVNRGIYAPGKSRLLINFIDDLNLSKSFNYAEDEAAARAAAGLELIRRYHESCEWHDTETGETTRLSDVMFLGALTQDRWSDSRGGDEWMEPRFFRHFSIYTIDEPPGQSVKTIYSSILLTNLRRNLFNPDVSGSVNGMIDATIDLYTSIRQKLRPIPSKFYYQFSLRDVARVIAGCSLIHKDSAESKLTLVRLWVHEAIRVFGDRIIDGDDDEWLFGSIRETVRSRFNEPIETIFDSLPKNSNDQLTRESLRQLIFSDFMDSGSWRPRKYEEILGSREALGNKAVAYLKRHNDEHAASKLNLLINSGSLEHLLRIARVVGTPGGSLLIISFGGSGRRSLTALAASIRRHNYHELSYNPEELRSSTSGSSLLLFNTWRRDAKDACANCIDDCDSTSSSKHVGDCTFFVTDRQIVGDGMIMDEILSLIKTGGIPDLFSDDETDDIVERCRILAQNGDRNREISRLSVMDYFYNKCQEKLHFVLYFNSSSIIGKLGNKTRGTTILKSIVSHCSIDCHEGWPDEAFNAIGNFFINDVDIADDVKSKAIVASKFFYDSVKFKVFRPDVEGETGVNGPAMPVALYIHMVKLYGISITRRQKEIRGSRERYMRGLEKLELAGEEVREIKRTLTSLRPELELSARDTVDTMRKIERENERVENATVQVKREEQVANRIAQVAGILKEECEAELAVAIPILEDAVAALNTLKPTDITLVKAMKNPPDTVKLVMAAVCVMLNVSPDRSVDPVTGKKSIDYWPPSKRILGDMNFLQNLKDYDKDNIPSGIMTVVNKTYMSDENFQPRIVAKASSAAEGLCKWVRAMVSYDEIAKVVAPKKEKLAVAEKECNASLEYLNEKRMSLEALNDKLAALKVVLESTLAKKLSLEQQVENCTRKLTKAENLITSLAGEKSRWLKSAETLSRSYELIAGDVLLSCGTVALLGAIDPDNRRIHLVEWMNKLDDLAIPNSSTSYDFVESLTDAKDDLTISNHLHDKLSRENATIADYSLLWPFFVDPQNQATIWIKRMEEANGLRVVKGTSSRWLGDVVACIEDNAPILVENFTYSLAETTALEYVLDRFCNRALPPSDSKNCHFRLYMTTRLFLTEASAFDWYRRISKKMSLINFTLTEKAIEDCLLEIVVSRDQPEIQQRFDKTTAESANNRRILREEEDNILTILSSSRVNIVDDARAMETLDYSKNLSLEIMRREELARSINREINEIRCNYRPLANYCAALYETLLGLASINHMYRYSLDWFTRLYVRSIDRSMKSPMLEKRLNYLKASFTGILHETVRNSLRDRDKLVYSFLLSMKTLVDSNMATPNEIVLLKEILLSNSSSIPGRPVDNEDTIMMGEKLRRSLPSVFETLPDSLRRDASLWRSYRESSAASAMPEQWENRLSDIQRLILVVSMKPERTINEIIDVAEKTLRTRLDSVKSMTSRYGVSSFFEESSCLVPLLFVLPTSYLEVRGVVVKWAEAIGHCSGVSRFSMGNGPMTGETSIVSTIERARNHGGWILLEDCHLASDQSLDVIENIYESLDLSDTKTSFRLWLTSRPSERFPISLLQNSVKINWEAPNGAAVRESLLRHYQTEPLNDPRFYDSCPGKNKLFAKLVYSLCLFHTVARGRQEFGNRGWFLSRPYQFNDDDLKISINQLQIFLNETDDPIPTNFDRLCYIIGECYYGGTIFDPLDRKLVSDIFRDYCNPDMIRATDNYVFATDLEARRYFVPNRSEHHDYKKHIIDTLPRVRLSPADIFSLDANAADLRDRRDAGDFIESLSLLDSHRVAGNEGRTSTTDRRRALIREIRAKLLDQDKVLDVVGANKKYPRVYEEPLNGLLIEEIKIYNDLLETIRDSILDVERTHEEGLAPLSLTFSAIEGLVESVDRDEVPAEWSRLAGGRRPERSLSRFIDHLSKRGDFLSAWIETGHRGTSFWLGGIVGCDKFISASRLTLARKSLIKLCDLAVDYEILDTFLPREPRHRAASTSEHGINVHGLFLSGARWDVERATLVESLPKLHFDRMPAIRLTPRSGSETDDPKIEDERCRRYECPVIASSVHNKSFDSSFSANCIATVPLATRDAPPEHWTKRTTALFSNRDE